MIMILEMHDGEECEYYPAAASSFSSLIFVLH